MSRHKKPILDTNSFIEYKSHISDTLLEKMKLSIIVLYELTATTISKQDFQDLNQIRQTFTKRDDLITPTINDWWETAKLIRRLRFGEKTAAGGLTPKMKNAHQLQNDALIARTAWTHDCFVVTTNAFDFGLFEPFMEKLEVISAEEFFA